MENGSSVQYHEAGHAVVALAQGVRIDEQGHGHTETVSDIERAEGKAEKLDVLRRVLAVQVAGHVAEHLHDPSSDSLVSRRFTAREGDSAPEDVAQAGVTVMGIMLLEADFGSNAGLRREVHPEDGVPEVVRAERLAEQLLKQHWQAVEDIVAEMRANKSGKLTHDRLTKLVGHHFQVPTSQ